MHILYMTQYFTTEDRPCLARHYRHVKLLREYRHRVSVVTSYVTHEDRVVPDEYRGRKIVLEESEGGDVYKTYATPGYGNDLRSRLSNYLTFAFWAFWASLRVKDVNLVFASSPPLFLGLSGWLAARLKRVPFVFEVRDVWPDAAAAVGVMCERSLAYRALQLLERGLYEQAVKIIAVTPGIKDNLLHKGVPADKITTVTNAVDIDLFDKVETRTSNSASDGPFLVMYTGAHGINNALWVILEAAEFLKDHEQIRFELIGRGELRPQLIEDAKRRKLTNVLFRPPIPKMQIPAELSRADLCIFCVRKEPYHRAYLPNKIFDYFGAGKPVVVSGHGNSPALVEAAGTGLTVPPEDPQALADAILWMAQHRDEAKAMGRRAREYVVRHYNREIVFREYEAVLSQVADRARKRLW